MAVELRSRIPISKIDPLARIISIPGIYEVHHYPDVEVGVYMVVYDTGRYECVNEQGELFQPADEWVSQRSFFRIRATMTRDGATKRRITRLD